MNKSANTLRRSIKSNVNRHSLRGSHHQAVAPRCAASMATCSSSSSQVPRSPSSLSATLFRPFGNNLMSNSRRNCFKSLLSANTFSITSVPKRSTSIRSNTASIRSNTTSIRSNTTSIRSNTTSIRSNTTSIRSNITSIRSNIYSAPNCSIMNLKNAVVLNNFLDLTSQISGQWITKRLFCKTSLNESGDQLQTNDLPFHRVGDLSKTMVGQTVRLRGWVQSVRGVSKNLHFLVLRDASGIVQLVHVNSATSKMPPLTEEAVIAISGIVRARPEKMINTGMKTGEIEIEIQDLQVQNFSAPLPFDIRATDELASEEVRLKHRFLDIRRGPLLANLQKRSAATLAIRNYLHNLGFTEIETPYLFKATTESGAKEFIVPTRQIGKFYALPQSPQQYKQMLISAGVEKYFQIAKCFRDEDGRADRQPEFTQVDMEMAWIDVPTLWNTVEGLLHTVWKLTLNKEISRPFEVMTYTDAMYRFGSDKPDLRYGLEFQDLGAVQPGMRMLNLPKLKKFGPKSGPGSMFADLAAGPLASHFVFGEFSSAKSGNFVPFAVQNCSVPEGLPVSGLGAKMAELGVSEDDVVCLAQDSEWETLEKLGGLRIRYAAFLEQQGVLKIDPEEFRFLWVTEFPLFEKTVDRETQAEGLCSAHHPFTAPHPADRSHFIELLKNQTSYEPTQWRKELLKIRSHAYDVVLNGWEIGGGSVRNHQADFQDEIFKLLKINSFNTEFGHLMEALRLGCPPHGGLALGFDRLMAILCKTRSIRDVIAFPKSAGGNEILTGSPGPVKPEELAEFGLTVTSPK